MTNIELNQNHEGKLHLRVGSEYAIGAEVTGIQNLAGELTAVVTIPLKHARLGQVGNVVPFVRPQVETR